MPLLDHFHPPLKPRRHWDAFHGQWAGSIAAALNQGGLPPGYFAEALVRVGSIQVDVATFEDDEVSSPTPDDGEGEPAAGGGTAMLVAPAWAPPAPALTMPAQVPDDIEVRIFSEAEGDIVAAVELVSPGNKDRAEARRAFAAKCDVYLQRRVGLVIVDVVTSRRSNLHDELVRLRGLDESTLFPDDPPLYASAYRPVRHKSLARIDVWFAPLAVGASLPTLPLAIRGAGCFPLNLEAAYQDARQRSGLI